MPTTKKTKKDNGLGKLEMLLDSSIDLDSRRIYFACDITTDFVDIAVKSLHYLDKTKGTIELVISSDGGSVSSMFYLYDMIRQCKNNITTIGCGDICSAAVLILACGDKRFITENAMLMQHDIQGYVEGNPITVESSVRAFRRAEKKMWSLLAGHTNKSAAFWKEHAKQKGEIWLDAQEMIDWGVVDKILPAKRKRT